MSAYDIWFDPTARRDGQNTGDEIMVWLNHSGPPQPVGSKVATVSMAGATWDIWEGNIGWNVVSYVRTSGTGFGQLSGQHVLQRRDKGRGYASRLLVPDQRPGRLRTLVRRHWAGGQQLRCDDRLFTPTPTGTPTPTPSADRLTDVRSQPARNAVVERRLHRRCDRAQHRLSRHAQLASVLDLAVRLSRSPTSGTPTARPAAAPSSPPTTWASTGPSRLRRAPHSASRPAETRSRRQPAAPPAESGSYASYSVCPGSGRTGRSTNCH